MPNCILKCVDTLPGVSNLRPTSCMQPRMAVNAAQHKIVNLLKTLWDFYVIMCHSIFNVQPKTIIFLPLWHRDAKRLDTPALVLAALNGSLYMKRLSMVKWYIYIYHIFQTIRHTPPPQIWEENGGASYSLNVAYLAHWGWGAVVEWGDRR